MAANNETSLPGRNRDWYPDNLTEVNQPIRELLETYSHIPPGAVVDHVNKIRERGFASNPYPCIGEYRFLTLTLRTHPLYSKIVDRLRSPKATYLDLACCFGQDLRQLVKDGIPSGQLTGSDIEAPLMDLGYDLFQDRNTLQSCFVTADILQGAAQGKSWKEMEERSFDVVHCSAFFHLFPLPDQIAAAKNIATLVKKNGIIVGRQAGSVQPGDVPAIKEGSFSYRHDLSTFEQMWKEVGQATHTQWKVEGSMDMVDINPQSPVQDEYTRRFLFSITRIE